MGNLSYIQLSDGDNHQKDVLSGDFKLLLLNGVTVPH